MHSSEKFDAALRAPATPQVVTSTRLRFAAAATESLLSGARELRRSFIEQPVRTLQRGERLTALAGHEPEAILLRSGFAFRACAMPDGRRAILDVLTVGDVAGLDHIVAHPLDELIAASRVGFNALPVGELRRLMANEQVALQISALLVEARWRALRLAVAIGRLDAQARICLFLLDIYDRLFRNGLLARPTFNLPLTQENIADHLGLTVVHVNRTLKRLREARLVLVDRQVVIIQDLPRLRQMIEGVLQSPELIAQPFYGDADSLAPTRASSVEEIIGR
jgi:CRP/FNR family transcriptional regulator, anaerobic regulatory protein